MNAKINFINNTIKAGIFFIIPFMVILSILFKILEILSPMAEFIKAHADPNGVVPHFANFVTIALLLALFFGSRKAVLRKREISRMG